MGGFPVAILCVYIYIYRMNDIRVYQKCARVDNIEQTDCGCIYIQTDDGFDLSSD